MHYLQFYAAEAADSAAVILTYAMAVSSYTQSWTVQCIWHMTSVNSRSSNMASAKTVECGATRDYC